jgi:hypothetical protein
MLARLLPSAGFRLLLRHGFLAARMQNVLAGLRRQGRQGRRGFAGTAEVFGD